jgi:hypothetical protein
MVDAEARRIGIIHLASSICVTLWVAFVSAILPSSGPKGYLKAFFIGLIVVIAGLGIWRFMASRVDFSKPDQVARAFTAALKSENVDKASKYWVPSEAEAWRTSANEKITSMQSGTFARFFEDLPDGSVAFSDAPSGAKSPANEKLMRSGDTTLSLREVEGKWYICHSPL